MRSDLIIGAAPGLDGIHSDDWLRELTEYNRRNTQMLAPMGNHLYSAYPGSQQGSSFPQMLPEAPGSLTTEAKLCAIIGDNDANIQTMQALLQYLEEMDDANRESVQILLRMRTLYGQNRATGAHQASVPAASPNSPNLLSAPHHTFRNP
jgi:hypothetical protein